MKRILALFLLLFLAVSAPGQTPGSPSYAYVSAALSSGSQLASLAPATLCGYNIANSTGSIAYVQFWNVNATSAATAGTTPPFLVLAIPAFSVIDNAQIPGVAFGRGIVIAATTTPNGSTGPTSSLSLSLLLRY